MSLYIFAYILDSKDHLNLLRQLRYIGGCKFFLSKLAFVRR